MSITCPCTSVSRLPFGKSLFSRLRLSSRRLLRHDQSALPELGRAMARYDEEARPCRTFSARGTRLPWTPLRARRRLDPRRTPAARDALDSAEQEHRIPQSRAHGPHPRCAIETAGLARRRTSRLSSVTDTAGTEVVRAAITMYISPKA